MQPSCCWSRSTPRSREPGSCSSSRCVSSEHAPIKLPGTAPDIAKAQEHSFTNVYGNNVEWVLREVLDVIELLDDAMKEGAEVYYSFLNEREARQLSAALRHPQSTPTIFGPSTARALPRMTTASNSAAEPRRFINSQWCR